jgi:hypothetical protein
MEFFFYETWSLTSREGNRLRVFEDWVLRRISGPNTYAIEGD